MSRHLTKDVNHRAVAVLSVLLASVVAGCALMTDTPREAAAPTAEPAATRELARVPALKATDIHAGLDYPLDDVANTKKAPRIFLDSLDADLDRIPDVTEKKSTFFRIMLPIIAQENDRIRSEREKILANPDGVSGNLFDRYAVDSGDVDTLLRRVDVVPASLVLAQAALESGWGTSRFAREGNNFFGLRTYDPGTPGLAPKEADGFKVRSFESIAESVRVYLHNINTHDAYKSLRSARADLREQGKKPDGSTLSHYLASYSEIPEKYGQHLRTLMTANTLGRFDGTVVAEN